MKVQKYELPPFESHLTKGELAAVLVYLPLHFWLLPIMGGVLLEKGWGGAKVNFLLYAIGAVYLLIFLGRFLRRDFDPLCEHPMRVAVEVISCYGMMLCFNFVLGLLLSFLPLPGTNPNNDAVMAMAKQDYGYMAAMTIFLAPLVEELVFRAGIFGFARRFSRRWAYVIGIALFAMYHIWPYALAEPIYWLFMIQYVPAGYLLCSCYERSASIWGSIFYHMLINAISLQALSQLENML